MGHLFLNPSCPVRFAAAVDDARQRQNRQRRMAAVYARIIFNFRLLIFHKKDSATRRLRADAFANSQTDIARAVCKMI
jgi:hypothetical protein